MLLGCIRKRKTKRVSALILALIISVSSIIGAVFTVPVSVFALSAGGIHTTIASLILSLILQTGAAPVNQTWINSLNSAYGYTIETAISEGLLTESAGGLVDSGLSSSIASSAEYTSLGLSDIFTTTAADGAAVIPASGAVNIANTAIHVGTAGTIGTFAGAVGIGVGTGVLINHVRDFLGRWIKAGCPLDYTNTAIAEPTGYNNKYSFYYQHFGVKSTREFALDDNTYVIPWMNSEYDFGYTIYSKVSTQYYFFNSQNQWARKVFTTKKIDEKSNTNNNRDKLHSFSVGVPRYTYSEAQRVVDEFLNNDTEPEKYNNISPDIIGPEGNQTFDRENDTFPGLVNQIPDGSDMVPVNMEDYQNYIDNANNNTNNGDTGQPIQGEDFDNLIDSLIVDIPTIPDEPIIPDQPVDVPTVPDRPVTPDQPTMPNKPELTDQEIQEALNGVTTIDLRSVFPFCIPFDLYNILLIFDTGENRKAPHITFTFPFTGWVIDVDLEPFDPVAGILRLLELILFIIGLAVATRKLIGAGGG